MHRSLPVFALAALIGLTSAADAKCTRLAFSVNDYGKEGPTRDAKALLDKYIAEWTAERGIKKYTTGKKDVTCELFLDLIIFDEYTCKASATVCWGDNQPVKAKAGDPPSVVGSAGKAEKSAPAKASTEPVKAKAATGDGRLTTGTVPKTAPGRPAASPPAATPAAAAAPSAVPAAAAAPAVVPAAATPPTAAPAAATAPVLTPPKAQ